MREFSVIVSGFSDTPDDPTSQTALSLGSAETQAWLEQETQAHVQVTPVLVPLSFDKAWSTLLATIEEVQPQIVVCLGRRRGAPGIALDRSARNRIETDHPDADGMQPLPGPIEANGPAAYWTRLPLGRILNAFATHNVPASLSSDAGTYVCNALFYHLMHYAHDAHNLLGGLICLPDWRTTDQSGLDPAGLTASQMSLAGRLVIAQTVLFHEELSAMNPLVPQQNTH